MHGQSGKHCPELLNSFRFAIDEKLYELPPGGSEVDGLPPGTSFKRSSKMEVISKTWSSSFGGLREVGKLKLYRM